VRAASPDLSWTRIREAIEAGQVSVNGEIVRDPGAPIGADAAVVFDPARRRQRQARLDLVRLHEDADILVVDKPAGLLSMATDALLRHHEDTVLRRAQEYAAHLHGRRGYAGLLHRLDRDTSGAMALALSREAHVRGRAFFAAHRFERTYLALVHGVPAIAEGTIDAAISHGYTSGRRQLARRHEAGREAVTHYRVRERFDSASLIELTLETGRQHQIRLHMQRLGHPLLGEKVYVRAREAGRAGAAGRRAGSSTDAPRQMLHAWRLAFPHPITESMVRVEAALPADFEHVLRALRRDAGASR
jgi:23S rRNA pseudouridine1911/1915/1917 synthase